MKLVIQAGPDAGQEFPVSGASISIGREIGNDVILHDNEVSRRHAEMRQTEMGYTITDLNSTNGTFVNDARVIASQPLQPGDRIRVGSTILSFGEGIAAPISMPEWAPPVERERGLLPFLLVAAIVVMAILIVMFASRPRVAPAVPTATPTTVATPTSVPVIATATPVPSRTRTPVPSPTATLVPVTLCPNSDVRITSPLPGAELTGIVEVFGTASIDQFAFYKLEYGVGKLPSAWSAIGEPTYYSPAHNARLAIWDTTVLPEEQYTLRLTVVDTSGNYPPPCEVKVYIKR